LAALVARGLAFVPKTASIAISARSTSIGCMEARAH
jgi:hypothetical protein